MKRLHIYIYSIFVALTTAHTVHAQTNKIYAPAIYTLQTIVNDDWLHDDIITLGTDDWVSISFDHLSHDYHRFIYKIIHCNADWTPSDLYEVDYMDGFNNQPFEDYTNSMGTTMLYTHYRLDLPNDDIQFKASGNYRVEIYLDDDEDNAHAESPVAVACFRIIEPRMNLHATVTSNTDIDTHQSHQQVSFTLTYPTGEVIDPIAEIKPYVYQNDRDDTHVSLMKPTYSTPGHLEYTHQRTLIFPAGNEYRRFEVTDMHYATQGVDRIEYHAPYYHATLLPDSPRRHYSFDIDHDGRYLIHHRPIHTSDEDANTEADYLFVHFQLDIPLRTGGHYYLTGAFTYDNFTPQYRMEYNATERCYETTLLLKQGAYDYMYVWVPDGTSIGHTDLTEGNSYEAENEYQIYIYHRPFGGRYDRLVATQEIKFEQE